MSLLLYVKRNFKNHRRGILFITIPGGIMLKTTKIIKNIINYLSNKLFGNWTMFW